MAINPIPSIGVNALQGLTSTTSSSGSSSVEQIGKSFQQILDSLNQSQQTSDDLVQKVSLGEDVDLHDLTIGLEENDVNFQVALAVRDKLISAYQEIMRMQV
jgi:flagellar hook-basal body complex protein FliE